MHSFLMKTSIIIVKVKVQCPRTILKVLVLRVMRREEGGSMTEVILENVISLNVKCRWDARL